MQRPRKLVLDARKGGVLAVQNGLDGALETDELCNTGPDERRDSDSDSG